MISEYTWADPQPSGHMIKTVWLFVCDDERSRWVQRAERGSPLGAVRLRTNSIAFQK